MTHITEAQKYLETIEKEQTSHISLTNIGLKNVVAELPELLHFKGITELNLSNNKISDLKFVQHFPDLIHLNLEYNQIQSLKPLESLKHLKTLRLHKNKIKDISPLKHLTHLEFLSVSENKIIDIEAIRYLKNLKTFDAWKNKITDISPLCKAEALIAASLQFNDIGEIPQDIKQLSHLKELYLGENALFVEDYEELLKDWLPNTEVSWYEDEWS